jgi:hypothetical protein
LVRKTTTTAMKTTQTPGAMPKIIGGKSPLPRGLQKEAKQVKSNKKSR